MMLLQELHGQRPNRGRAVRRKKFLTFLQRQDFTAKGPKVIYGHTFLVFCTILEISKKAYLN
jgi:hypothetical protein